MKPKRCAICNNNGPIVTPEGKPEYPRKVTIGAAGSVVVHAGECERKATESAIRRFAGGSK